MTIVNRALIREVLQTSGAVTFVMLSIFMVVRVVGFLRDAAEGDIPVDSVVELLVLKLVTYMDVLLPLIIYVSVIMVMARWSRDNELAVLASSGVGVRRLLRPLLVVAVFAVVLVGGFSLYLAPLAVRAAETIQHEYDTRSEVSGIVPGVFTSARSGSGVFFVEEFDGSSDRYRNIFVYSVESDGREGVVVADSGFRRTDVLTNDQFLVLKDGTRFEGTPGAPEYTVVEFESYAIRLKERAKKEVAIPVSGIATRYLFRQDHHRIVSERQWRMAKPISVPILILFALALSRVDSRRSRLPSMFAAFIVYFAYTNLLGLTAAMMNKGRIEPSVGLWSVHGLFALLALYLFMRRSRDQTILPRLRSRPGPSPA